MKRLKIPEMERDGEWILEGGRRTLSSPLVVVIVIVIVIGEVGLVVR
jgi:hypothetical protein